MNNNENNFELQVNNVTIKVERLNLPGHVAFQVTFTSARLPIVIARAEDFNASRFWTSIPEGRQKEAEGVGILIEEYFKSQNK
ncbi:MAG TPA: hypothetical protein VK543_16080 [Puia sp.]|nr:hypothetical protein [Puia sp.]